MRKLDEQVAMLRNLIIAHGLENGSRGVVAGFSKDDQDPVLRFASGQTVTNVQLGLKMTNTTTVPLPSVSSFHWPLLGLLPFTSSS